MTYDGVKSRWEIEKNAKLLILIVLVCIVFGLLSLKLFSMQVLEGKSYQDQAVDISSRSKEISAQRGEIYDRNAASPLVVNVDSFAVDITPGEIPKGQYDTVAMRLAGYLHIGKTQIDTKIPPSQRGIFTAVEVKANVPFSEISNIAENLNDLPGVTWRSKPRRNYTAGGSLSHVLGYVGNITGEERKLLYNNKIYSRTSVLGKTGVERQYDELLQGKNGAESQTVDVRGRLMSAKPIVTPPEMGKNLVLTIDAKIQLLAEKALREHTGAVVALNAGTGEILALVSYPFFDANAISADNSGAYAALSLEADKPLLNRAVNAVYPPASTFKTVMTTAILTENSFPRDRLIECTGQLVYGQRDFHCHVWPSRHGFMDLKNGLAQSCDVYFWVVGRENVGIERISYYGSLFGIGKSLEIDMPSSSSGLMPTSVWKERTRHEPWVGGDTMNVSIGQGDTLVTPLHVANMMAMVVNSGKIYRPHVLKEVRDPVTGEVIKEVKPEVLHEAKDVPPDVWATLQTNLRYTVTNGAVINSLTNRAVQIAGKTGTAQVGKVADRYHSWWVGYGPYNAPPEETVVVCVLMETLDEKEPGATYTANITFQGIFANQTYEEALNALGWRWLVNYGRTPG